MAFMMQIANRSLADPGGKSSIQPGLTNRQFFKLVASQTHTSNIFLILRTTTTGVGISTGFIT